MITLRIILVLCLAVSARCGTKIGNGYDPRPPTSDQDPDPKAPQQSEPTPGPTTANAQPDTWSEDVFDILTNICQNPLIKLSQNFSVTIKKADFLLHSLDIKVDPLQIEFSSRKTKEKVTINKNTGVRTTIDGPSRQPVSCKTISASPEESVIEFTRDGKSEFKYSARYYFSGDTINRMIISKTNSVSVPAIAVFEVAP